MLAILLCTPLLWAGAWVQPDGKGQLILTNSYYRIHGEYNGSRQFTRFDYNGDYRQWITYAYLEFGVSKHDAMILNFPIEALVYKNNYSSASFAGPGDVEASWSHRLNRDGARWIYSFQTTVKFPAYAEQNDPAPGNHQVDAEARVSLGHGHELGRAHLFWDAETAYRYRGGEPADQFRADGTTGLDFWKHRLMVMGQVFTITSLQNGGALTANTNPNLQADFDLYKAQASLVVKTGHNTRVQAGWNDAFAGRNTGNGQTFSLALWKTF